MKPGYLAALCLALSLTMVAAAGACTRVEGVTKNFVTWVNELRAGKGLGPLRLSPALGKAAETHVCDMARNNFMDHRGSRGSTLKSRLRSVSYRLSTATENIARTSRAPSAQSIATLWANSPPHLSNLLIPDITEMGLGVAVENGMTYYVFVGARPR